MICLPYAGGNSFIYQRLGKYLDDFIEPVAVELPGHGLLFNEPQLNTLDEMANYVLDKISSRVRNTPWHFSAIAWVECSVILLHGGLLYGCFLLLCTFLFRLVNPAA